MELFKDIVMSREIEVSDYATYFFCICKQTNG